MSLVGDLRYHRQVTRDTRRLLPLVSLPPPLEARLRLELISRLRRVWAISGVRVGVGVWATETGRGASV